MTEDKKVFELGTVPLIGKFELVAIPSLIEVQVIKKKIVDQMSEIPLKMLEEYGSNTFRVIGRVGPYAVFHSDSHQFVKIHRNDFTDYAQALMVRNAPKDMTPDVKILSEESNKIFYRLPQLFEG